MKTILIALAMTIGSLSALAGDCPEGTEKDADGNCVVVDSGK